MEEQALSGHPHTKDKRHVNKVTARSHSLMLLLLSHKSQNYDHGPDNREN
jgi:hypothetical protein